MKRNLFRLALILVLAGLLPTIPPADALALEGVWYPLRDDSSGDPRDGGIVIDLAHGQYTINAAAVEQTKGLYYEVMAYNPSANPATITWGLIRVNPDNGLHFRGLFDSYTLAWMKSYGLAKTSFSVRPV